MDNTVAALPPPVPSATSVESPVRELLARHAREVLELMLPVVEESPVRGLSIVESYAAAQRHVLADLAEAPSPRRQRRRLSFVGGPGDDFPLGPPPGVHDVVGPPPGAMHDVLGETGFLGRLESMIDKQTSSQTAGATASEIKNLSVAMNALPEDDPLREDLRAQLDARITALKGEAPQVLIETGLAEPPSDADPWGALPSSVDGLTMARFAETSPGASAPEGEEVSP